MPTPTVQWFSNDVPLHPLQQPYQQLYLVPTDSPHTTVYNCIGRNNIRGVDHVAQANVTVIVESKQTGLKVYVTYVFILTELCPTLKPPVHGELTTSNDGEFAFFSCCRGFTIRGSDVLQCINGKWNRPPPSCQSIPWFCRWKCKL